MKGASMILIHASYRFVQQHSSSDIYNLNKTPSDTLQQPKIQGFYESLAQL